MAATLYLVSTPIGNLEDITLRALRILREEVSLIACEDTRQTTKLLEHFSIRKPLLSYHDFNEEARAAELLDVLKNGQSVALVSDAGTPLVSDPGYRVVCAAINGGIPVVPVPGASAALAALAGSGLAPDQFRFIGFLPAKSGARRRLLESLSNEHATVIAYESPHRIMESLADLTEVLGDRKIVLAREVTKLHEEFLRGTAQDIRLQLESRGAVRGEITLVIGRPAHANFEIADPAAEVKRLVEAEGFDRMSAIKNVAKRMGLPKREVYRLLSEQDAAEPDNSPPGKCRD